MNVEELSLALETAQRENAQLKAQLEREVKGRLARHAAKRTVSKIRKACRRLAARPVQKGYDGWRQDRASRKAARRTLRAIGAVVGS